MNRMKYPLTIIAGIVTIIAISLGAIVTAGKADEGLRHVLYAVIVATVLPTVTTLLAILKSEKNSDKIDQNTALTVENTALTVKSQHDAEQIARDLAEAKVELARAKVELAKRDEELIHQLKGVRTAGSLAADLNIEAIEWGKKAYSESNGMNHKLTELRTDFSLARGDRIVEAVHDVDQKVVAVDQKVSDIQKHVAHEGE